MVGWFSLAETGESCVISSTTDTWSRDLCKVGGSWLSLDYSLVMIQNSSEVGGDTSLKKPYAPNHGITDK